MLPALKVGGRYEAAVERVHADGRVTLVIDGVAMTARARTILRVGSRIEVEVERIVPELLLRVLARRRKKVPAGTAEAARSAGSGRRE